MSVYECVCARALLEDNIDSCTYVCKQPLKQKFNIEKHIIMVMYECASNLESFIL